MYYLLLFLQFNKKAHTVSVNVAAVSSYASSAGTSGNEPS